MNTQELSFKRIFTDGTSISLALSALIMGSLYYDAEIWVHDYPPDIQAAFGPKSRQAHLLTLILAVPFFFIAIGGIVYSNLKLKKQNGGTLSVPAAFINAYALFIFFWLYDLTILDWLFFVKVQPDFIVLPGTEGMAGYKDYAFHLTTALPALLLGVIPCGIIAILTARNYHGG